MGRGVSVAVQSSFLQSRVNLADESLFVAARSVENALRAVRAHVADEMLVDGAVDRAETTLPTVIGYGWLVD